VPPPTPSASTLYEVPGLFTTASKDGSLFARGFDPITGSSKASVVDFHYSGDTDHTWGQPETGEQFALPNELAIYSIPARQMDSLEVDFTNETTVMVRTSTHLVNATPQLTPNLAPRSRLGNTNTTGVQ
jgi:hypothetical protein